MRSWKFLLPLLASSLCFAAQPDRITGVIDSSQMVALQNNVSLFASPENDQGPVSSSLPLRVTILFTPTAAQQSALDELLKEQQDRKSPKYHKWLTPEQFADQFGLSANDIAKIKAWLQAQGFAVTYVARGRESISFAGSAAQVEMAFRTQIHSFGVNGKTHFANTSSPMIPAALDGIVGGFRGLHNFVPHRMSVPHPDYTLSGATTHFLAPGDIATIYDINPLYQASTPIDGTGQKMVIVGQTDIYPADLTYFRADFGLAGTINCTTNASGYITSCAGGSTLQFVIPSTATDPGVNAGDLGESDLDLEWAGAVAPNATIIFVTSDYNSGGVNNSMSWAIDNQLAPVISMSYGLCEAYAASPPLSTQDLTFKQGASEGISIFAASGDSAAAICDGDAYSAPSSATLGQSVSYPASDPWVTGVGGTEFNEGSGTYWNTTNGTDLNSAISYIPELAWNDSTAAISQSLGFDGTGGGPSNCENYSSTTTEAGYAFSVCDAPPAGGFAKPSYQTALTPSDSVRDVPDISFSASNFNDPYIICTAQSETNGSSSTSTCVSGIENALNTYNSAFGGTSAATPVAAGMTVLLNQYLGQSGLGLINTQLYQLFTSNPTAFHDIVAGTSTFDGDTSNNVVPCTPNTPSITGYPSALQCPAGGTLGYSAGTGYDLVTGLGSADFNVLFQAWKAALAPQFSLTVTPPTTASVSAGNSTSFTITVAPISGATPTVNFTPSSCSGIPTGATCSFNPAGVTLDGVNSKTVTVTIATMASMALVSGANVVITPTGSSITTTVSLTVTATTQSFTIAPTNGTNSTYSVVAGQAATVNISITGHNGFTPTALPLTFTCTGLPSEATGAFSPGTGENCAGANGISASSVTLTISTTAATTELRRPLGRGNRIFYAMLLPGVFGIVFAAGSRGRGARLLGLIMVLALSTLWLGACGGSSGSSQNNPGTPAGSYTVTVQATTGAPTGGTALTSTFNITLTVTQ